jgi:hypothetical protein
LLLNSRDEVHLGDLLTVDLRTRLAYADLPYDQWIRAGWRSGGEYAQAWIRRSAVTLDYDRTRRKAYVIKRKLPLEPNDNR